VIEVLRLNEFDAALPFIEHGFGTRHRTSDMSSMAVLRQIHSSRVILVTAPGLAGEGDALVTQTRGLPLAIRTADCYPILLADPRTRTIAAVHAGWRGTAERIAGKAIETMRAQFGSCAADIFAAFGPGIGECCYEVGEEVARRFGRTGHGRIDLARANRDQLIKAGVPAAQIHSLARCTFCEPDLFHSYRRDREQAGRMISFISIVDRPNP